MVRLVRVATTQTAAAREGFCACGRVATQGRALSRSFAMAGAPILMERMTRRGAGWRSRLKASTLDPPTRGAC